MSSRMIFAVVILASIFTTACQQKNPHRVALDRRARSGATDQPKGTPTAPGTVANTCSSESKPGKQWGEITNSQGDNTLWTESYYLTLPVLQELEQPDQLGFLSASSGRPTGIRFWGHLESAAGNGLGAIKEDTAELRIEFYDDRACAQLEDGTLRPIIPIHIKKGLKNFVKASGNMTASRTTVAYEDNYGVMTLDGAIVNGYYQGTVKYSLKGYNGERFLGQFKVPKCGFFRC